MNIKLLQLPDGRHLAYAQYGSEHGKPLLFFHGFPGSHSQARMIEREAEANDISIIAPDRPGFGGSTPAPGRTLLSWASDVAALATALGHQRFDVMGVSCGGAYALACAHELGDRVMNTFLIAGMGPMDVPILRHGQLPVLTIIFKLARRLPWAISPLLALDRWLYRRDPLRAVEIVAGMLSKPDRQVLNQHREYAEAFGASLAEAYLQGIGGAMCEAQLIGSPRPYELQAITTPVHVLQGAHDRHVPPAMGKYLAEHLPRGRLYEYPEEGHLSILPNTFRDVVRLMRDATPSRGEQEQPAP